MEIKKIANFTEEEFDLLIKTGELFSKVKTDIENGDIDGLNDVAENILAALKEVINKILDC